MKRPLFQKTGIKFQLLIILAFCKSIFYIYLTWQEAFCLGLISKHKDFYCFFYSWRSAILFKLTPPPPKKKTSQGFLVSCNFINLKHRENTKWWWKIINKYLSHRSPYTLKKFFPTSFNNKLLKNCKCGTVRLCSKPHNKARYYINLHLILKMKIQANWMVWDSGINSSSFPHHLCFPVSSELSRINWKLSFTFNCFISLDHLL